jgi:hypothetical protein
MIDHAVQMRRAGYNYPQIADKLKEMNVTDHNGQYYHNAFISNALITKYPGLRVRTRLALKTVTKTAKRKYTKRAKANSTSNARVISKLKSAGLTNAKILEILSSL